MSKSKRKIGLQKNFSEIFDGVWIPPKPGSESASPEPASERRDKAAEAPAQDDRDRPAEPPAPGDRQPAIEAPPLEEQEHVSDGERRDEQAAAVEAPAGGGSEQADATETVGEHDRRINEIIGSMKCPKDFICYKSDFKQLCKVKKVGEGKIIECSPENRGPCVYRFSFTGKLFCKCPLRYYIARHFNM